MLQVMSVKKNARVAKEEKIYVRCTAEQRANLDAVAAKEGLSLSTWLLHVGLLAVQERRIAK
jgi:hypothetical protein